MKKFHKKSLALLVSVALLLTFAVSGTVAYLVDASGPVENQFKPASVTPSITETINGSVKNDVKLINSGNVDAYIRAAVVVTWQMTDSDGIHVLPAKNTDYSISWSKSGWIGADSNGYYYYTTPVSSGTETGVLFTSCSVASGVTPPSGYSLHVEIMGQAIQAEPISTVKTVWGVTVDPAGVITAVP